MVKILYFSVNEWGNMGRRKPRLAYEFACQPGTASVLYVEPPVQTSVLDLVRGRFEPGHLGPSRAAHRDALFGRSHCVRENMWAYTGSAKTVPLTRVGVIRRMDVLHRINKRLYLGLIRRCLRKLPGDQLLVWLNHPLQARLLDAFPERVLLCYDWTDDWTAFDLLPVEDPQEIFDLNDRLVREADIVFTVSEELRQRAEASNPNTYRAPNATDPVVLGTASDDGPIAPALAKLSPPIIGYIGQIGDKIDYQLVGMLARARPNWSFAFVGPIWYSKQPEIDALSALPNIHFVGLQPYRELPSFLRAFDVCILPHLCSRLTRSMDPIKLYDYLVSGKPIVSTSVAGVDRFADVVRVADGAAELIVAIEQALTENGALRDRRLEYARQNSWPARAAEMWRVIEAQVAKRGMPQCQP